MSKTFPPGSWSVKLSDESVAFRSRAQTTVMGTSGKWLKELSVSNKYLFPFSLVRDGLLELPYPGSWGRWRMPQAASSPQGAARFSLLPRPRSSLSRTSPSGFRRSMHVIHFLVGHPCYLTWKARCNAWFLVYMGYTFATLYNQNVLKNKLPKSIFPSPLEKIRFKSKSKNTPTCVFFFLESAGACRGGVVL